MSEQPEGMVPLDCVKCGACCLARAWLAGDGPFIDLHGAREVNRIERLLPKRYKLQEDARPYALEAYIPVRHPETEKARCVFLKGVEGETVSCGIYKDRPKVCQNFNAGSKTCLIVRRKIFGRKRLPESADGIGDRARFEAHFTPLILNGPGQGFRQAEVKGPQTWDCTDEIRRLDQIGRLDIRVMYWDTSSGDVRRDGFYLLKHDANMPKWIKDWLGEDIHGNRTRIEIRLSGQDPG